MFKRMIRVVALVMAVLGSASPGYTQSRDLKLGGETEWVQDPNGFNVFSQYVFLDDTRGKWNGLVHYFRVEGAGVEYAEAKIGPTCRLGRLLVKAQVGVTTDGGTTAGLCLVWGRGKAVYILDPHWYDARPDTVYQKVMLPQSVRLGSYQFGLRVEHLSVGGHTAFLRSGLELPVGKKTPFFVTPFYDIHNHAFGGMVTARF